MLNIYFFISVYCEYYDFQLTQTFLTRAYIYLDTTASQIIKTPNNCSFMVSNHIYQLSVVTVYVLIIEYWLYSVFYVKNIIFYLFSIAHQLNNPCECNNFFLTSRRQPHILIKTIFIDSVWFLCVPQQQQEYDVVLWTMPL